MESEVKRGQIVYSFLLLAIVLIFAFVFLIPSDIQSIFTGKAIVNNTICTPQWSCTAWSPCLGDSQIRSCVDVNSCGNQTNKPLEALTCGVCEPNWQCGEWEPEECPETEIQKKECKDLNNCGTIRLKPADTKSCTYFKNFGWIYWFIIMLQLLMIIRIILIIQKIILMVLLNFNDFYSKTRNMYKKLFKNIKIRKKLLKKHLKMKSIYLKLPLKITLNLFQRCLRCLKLLRKFLQAIKIILPQRCLKLLRKFL